MDVIEKINLRFKSGNSIPIERTHLTADEWAELKDRLRNASWASEAARDLAHEIYYEGFR